MPRSHRTALVFDITSGVNSEVEERFSRLLQSVNGPNIKVDTYVLRRNGASVEIVPGTPKTVSNIDVPETSGAPDVDEWAKAQGYTQSLFAKGLR